MKCADLENTLALLADGETSAEDSAVLVGHLSACPLCRQKGEDYGTIRRDLRQMASPSLPASVRMDLKLVLRTELRREERRGFGFSKDFVEWLQMRLMPFGVGVAASVIVGVGLLTIMFSGQLRRANDAAFARTQSSPPVLLAANHRPDTSGDFDLTAADIANSRMQFAQVSPSINPQGALVALTKSLVRGRMKDEEVVVVADVFSNGVAKINEVVESPEDGYVIGELEKALRNETNRAPFVPTVIENRPENMQIILKLQYVNVKTGLKPARRRS